MKKLYHFLYTCLYYETFIYELSLTKEQIIEQFNVLFKQKNAVFRKPNLTGNFTGNDSFELFAKWSFIYLRGTFPNKPTRLKGVIQNTENNKTKIEIAVRQNNLFVFMFIIWLLFGLIMLIPALLHSSYKDILTASFVLVLSISFILLTALYVTRSLRRSFEKYFDVEPVKQ